VAIETAPRRLPGHPRALLGRGVAGQLGPILDEFGADRVLVLHGAGATGRPRIAALLRRLRTERAVVGTCAVRPNPDLSQARAAIAAMRTGRPDAVVGIGGGSVLDMAKVAALGTGEPPGPVLDGAPDLRLAGTREAALVLVPTIAGSGSEMTRFATVYVDGVKRSVDHPAARADVVLVDPDLFGTVPPRAGVPAALDALAQAAESLWAVRATPASRALARQALERLAPALGALRAAASFADPRLREDLAVGAAAAGAAIDQTRTTAAHALSYPLTARRNVPHGAAVALHFHWLLGYHGQAAEDCLLPGGAGQLHALVADIETTIRRGSGMPPDRLIRDLLRLAGQPASLAELRLDPQEWAPLFAAALGSDRAANNPRPIAVQTVLRAASAR
jgi:alcohol dehydrogenase class IV